MKKIFPNDLFEKGMSYIDEFNEFEFITDSYSKEFSQYNPFILKRGFISVDSKMVGRDSEVSIVKYRKKTKEELDSENLKLQIEKLESKFKVKITYTNV